MKMFFYILYVNDKVVGFAEYGYLPNSGVLFIDYICTNPRNPTFFYNFYQMLFEEINELLKKNYHHFIMKLNILLNTYLKLLKIKK